MSLQVAKRVLPSRRDPLCYRFSFGKPGALASSRRSILELQLTNEEEKADNLQRQHHWQESGNETREDSVLPCCHLKQQLACDSHGGAEDQADELIHTQCLPFVFVERLLLLLGIYN